jgi:SAM-dependent methyltransferase
VTSGYDPALFDALAGVEADSFWFRARNRLIVSTLRAHFPDAASLLEVGCGTGFVLAGLRRAFPSMRLVGSELHEEGLEVARARVPDAELVQLDVLQMPFAEEFDVVGAFDVLEHVDDDVGALAGMRRAVRPGGGVLLLVPQHPWLWSTADDVARHVRRYRRRELTGKVADAGLEVVRATSFVSSLLPVMAASRVVQRLRRSAYDPRAELVPGLANRPFERLLDGERRLIERGWSLPAGGSLLVVARRRR